MSSRFSLRGVALALAAPLAAVAFSLVVTSLLLVATGNSPTAAFASMIEYALQPRTMVLIINASITLYLSGVAVAIGFRMNLFNIGVDGQYRLATMLAAAFAGFVILPPVIAQITTILLAMVVGALWAGIAGLLRAYRGVSEVISTIMLNFIASAIVAYLLAPGLLAETVEGSNNIRTPPIPESGQLPGIPLIPGENVPPVYGFLLIAIAVGFGYWYLVERTRFGFDLRATGMNESAAIASGVDVKKMVISTMLISGAVAGLVGLPQLLGSTYTYSLDFPTGLGFSGIAIALLGRNHPIGIALAALVWAFLDQSAQILALDGISPDIVKIIQGVVVLSVVVAYEVLRRYRLRQVAADVSRQLAKQRTDEGVAA